LRGKHADTWYGHSAFPCHYGSFSIIEKNADKFVAEMKGSPTKVIVPEKGKAVEV
jgi:L-ascorbate metabolism protein UlaG (beta-lactamase superfamily)